MQEIDGNWDGQQGALNVVGDKPTIKFIAGPVAGNQSWILHVGSDNQGSLQFFKQADTPGNWTNVMTLTPQGVVGIGTVNPLGCANGKLVAVSTGGSRVAGVVGINDVADPAAAGNGGWFESARGEGVRGISHSEHGAVVGVCDTSGQGGYFESTLGEGVRCISHVAGHGGVVGINTAGGDAGYFIGSVHVTKSVTVEGDIVLTNADCAEEFEISSAAEVEPGTVMVLGPEGSLIGSFQPYDKRVAGVISGAGDYKPGIVLDKQRTETNRQPIALLGKVFCKVDAEFGAIEIGDLLTTSSTLGYAMKASDPQKTAGAVIGKALRPLASGQALLPILISLQ